jgi:hypothetical protein
LFFFSLDFSPPDDGKIKISIVVGAIVLVLLLISMILCILCGKAVWEEGYQGKKVICANLDVEIRKNNIQFLQLWQEVGTMCRKFLGKITPTCIEVSVSSTHLQTMGEMTLLPT